MKYEEYENVYDEKVNKRAREFLDHWLVGTTCKRHSHYLHWVSDCGNYAVLKHYGHSEWCGSWSGVQWCGTAYYLYYIKDKNCVSLPENCDNLIRSWQGRWKKTNWDEVRKLVESHKKEVK